MSRLARCIVGYALAASALSCDLFGPEIEAHYNMVLIGGTHLPATLLTATTTEGQQYEFRLLSETLILYDGVRSEFRAVTSNVFDGIAIDTTVTIKPGRYVITDSVLVLRLRDIDGIDQVFTYQLIESGRVLRGTQWNHEVEYVRD